MTKKVFIIVGEKSADLYGARIIAELKKQLPDLVFSGTGGDAMQVEGFKPIFHINQISYIGYFELIKHSFEIVKKMKKIKSDFLKFSPDLVLLIDYSGFNLSFARYVKENSSAKVVYFIPPSIWISKEYRANKLKQFTDELIVHLPFEQPFFKKKGLDAHYFGNPLAFELKDYPRNPKKFKRELLVKHGQKVIAIMLGSRNEVFDRLAPIALEVMKLLAKPKIKNKYKFVLSLADSISVDRKRRFLSQIKPYDYAINKKVATYALAHADFVLANSGTLTLEASLLDCPMIIYFRGSYLSMKLARMLIKLNYFGLPNIILKKEAVEEYIQERARGDLIARRIEELLAQPEMIAEMLLDYKKIQAKLYTEQNPYLEVSKIILKNLR